MSNQQNFNYKLINHCIFQISNETAVATQAPSDCSIEGTQGEGRQSQFQCFYA